MNRSLLVVAASALAGCITYDFEPVTPLAVTHTTRTETVRALGAKPNVMILLDKSGSMNFPIDPACTGAGCRTRIDDLRSAMGPFLSTYGQVARFGLTTFPKGAAQDQCNAPTGVRLDVASSNDVASELLAHAQQIDAIVQQLGGAEPVAGGTPTAASLGVVGALPSLNDPDRKNVVLLLTDGLPNCNGQHPGTCSAGGTCKCTLSATFDPSACAAACPTGCLDDLASVQAVRALAAAEIKTAVIGFGSDTNGSVVLDQMAVEGGLPRSCQVDADCGSAGPCNAGLCRTRFYQANDGAQLAAALQKIVESLVTPCEYKLGFVPQPGAKMAVLIDGQSVPESALDGWAFDAATSSIQLTGSVCSKAKASSPSNPMRLEIRVLEVLE